MQYSTLSNSAIFKSVPRLTDEAYQLYSETMEGLADTALSTLRLLKLVELIGWDTFRDHLIARCHADEPEGPDWSLYAAGDKEAWEMFEAAANELIAAQNAVLA